MVLIDGMHMTNRRIDVWMEQDTFQIDTRQFEVIVLSIFDEQDRYGQRVQLRNGCLSEP